MKVASILICGLALGIMASALYGLGVATHQPGSYYFTDCDPASPHDEDVGWLAEYPVAQGFGDGTYGPTLTVTREQMASFIMRQAALDITSAFALVDLLYGQGYYFGNAAYNAGRITWEEYLSYQRAYEWLLALMEYQSGVLMDTSVTATGPEVQELRDRALLMDRLHEVLGAQLETE